MATRIVTALLLAVLSVARAHEIGTTRVEVRFDQRRTYEIAIVTDAGSLSEKLAALAGSADAARLQSVLEKSDEHFRRRVRVTFDATDVRPVISYSVAQGGGPGASATATIRLAGEIPEGAARFQWTYGWTFATYGMTIRASSSSEPETEWLEGGQSSKPFVLATVAPAADRWHTAWLYLTLGFTHILPNGLDHMLFVLGLYLLSGRARTVLVQSGAFTVAHSITLGLSMYGVVSAPPRIVEPMIALSIAYVAIENVFLSELKPWRVGLVFGFGLLHGLGFAGALKELGLPRSEYLTALLTFNVGVEAGQLAVIGAAFMLVGWRYSNRPWYHNRVVVPVSAVIACMALYWTLERLA